MDQAQAYILNSRRQQLARYVPPAWTQLNGAAPPTSGRPFIVTPAPFPAYPAPGAAAINIISYTVPRGMNALITFLAIVHVGGGFIDGSGNVIWRVLVNGAGVKGLEALQSQVGSYAQPNEVQLVLQENDVIVVTVEVPAAQPAMVGTAAARFHGFVVPVVRR
jgi:hypothetical protein